MAIRKYYLPTIEAQRVTWLNNFALKLTTYAATFNLDPNDVALIAQAAVFYAYIIGRIDSAKSEVSSLVAYKNKLSFSTDNTPLGAVPQVELPPEPPAVPAGIFNFIARIVNDIKNSANYNNDIGADLRIIGEESITDDPSLLKPVLKVKLSTGGHPALNWKKKGADFTNVYVDRGAGFVFLKSVKGNKMTDMFALPAGGTSTPSPSPGIPGGVTPAAGAAVWRYKVVYVKNDAETGDYSDPVSIPVGQV